MGRLSSLLMGGLIGAGVAMLLAPRTGPETRQRLTNRAQGLRNQYGDVLEKGRLRATELVKTGREYLDEKLTQGTEAVNTAAERARTTMDTLQPQVTDAINQTSQQATQAMDRMNQDQANRQS